MEDRKSSSALNNSYTEGIVGIVREKMSTPKKTLISDIIAQAAKTMTKPTKAAVI